jgi:hypothetical protein
MKWQPAEGLQPRPKRVDQPLPLLLLATAGQPSGKLARGKPGTLSKAPEALPHRLT